MSLNCYETILCDLDGCLISGNTRLPGANEFVDYYRDKLWLVSNNSTDTPETMFGKLSSLGLDIPKDRIFLAGAIAIEILTSEKADKATAIFGSEAIQRAAKDAGLILTREAPEVVLLTRDTSFDYRALSQLVGFLEDGAELIVANCDNVHPGPNGYSVPETGALLQAVHACVPDLEFREIGKPGIEMLNMVLNASRSGPDATVMVGDNPRTDGEGASRMGLKFFQTGNGHFALMDLLFAEPQ